MVGLLFNVNMWYKLSGHTLYGVYITGLGAIITVVLEYNFYSFLWLFCLCMDTFVNNGIMLFLTYYYGQRIYKIEYDLKRIGLYVAVGLVLYVLGCNDKN